MDFTKDEHQLNIIVARFEEDNKDLRTGRAHISMVDDIKVESYGAKMPVRNVASIAIPDARTIVIKPWDKTILPAIEQALSVANIGGAPIAEKDQVRITIPAPTEERRKELARLLKKRVEESRIAVRQHRDNIWKRIQDAAHNKEISEDQKFSQKEKMEKLIEKMNDKITALAEKKEKEIMEA